MPRLLLLALAALAAIPATAHAAHPGHYDGEPLDVIADGAGRFQVRFDGAPNGEFFPPASGLPDSGSRPDAGFQLRVLTPDPNDQDPVLGGRVTQPQFQDFAVVDQPSVVIGSPGFASSILSHYSGGGLVVHEQLQHVAGDDFVRATYTVDNPLDSGPPIAFRAFATADLFSGSDRGTGFHNPAVGEDPEEVGGTNDHFGATGALAEISTWSAFQEGGFTTVFERVLGAGFSNTVDPAFIDNALGVQWDDFVNGLPDGGSASFDVLWRFPRFHAITFGEGVTSAAGTVGQPLAVPVQPFRGAVPQADQQICWSRTGVNGPASGAVRTDQTGAASIPLSGASAGTDTLTAVWDLEDMDCANASGPQRSIEVVWSAAPAAPAATLALSPASANRTVGEVHAVTATATGAVQGSLIQFSVAGPNAVQGTADVNPATGQGTIRWIGANPGHDVVTAFLDIDGDGLQDPGEPSATAAADWTAPDRRQPRQQALTLDDLPDPEPFREVNVQRIGPGPVFVRLPGTAARKSQAGAPRGFVPLEAAAQIPVGSILETSRGRVALESAADARGRRTQRAQFYAGMFQVRQPRSRRPVTEMVLKGGSFRGCGNARPAASWSRAAQRRRQGRRVRRVWGDGRGRFRTRGRYSSATVRGTKWLVEDRCNGTLTRVPARPRTSRVEVRDLVARRTRLLRAGQSYFAARPLGRR